MLPTLNLPLKSHPSSRLLFLRCNFSIKLSWLQKRDNKANNILSSKYIIYKTLKPLKKRANRTKYKQPNVPSKFHIF